METFHRKLRTHFARPDAKDPHCTSPVWRAGRAVDGAVEFCGDG